MRQKHLFVLDPLAGLNLKLDSSLRMAFELSLLGHEVFACEQRALGWQSGQSSAFADCQRLSFEGKQREQPRLADFQRQSLASFHGLHMRKEPPVDGSFLAATWLLESAQPQAQVFNSPAALRTLNEKMAIFQFPEATTPALASTNAEELLRFTREQCAGDAIIKPLDQFGGRGIFRLQLGEMSNADALSRLQEATDGQRLLRLAQPFNSAIFQGEVRAFALGGEPLAWCLKRPAAGSYLANTAAGAKLESYTPSREEVERVRAVAAKLFKAGVALVGFDMIGGWLSEVNITSPRLLQAAEDHHNYYATMATWFVDACQRQS